MKIDDISLPGERHQTSGARSSPLPDIDLNARSRGICDEAVVEAHSRQASRPALRQRLEALAGPTPCDPGSFDNVRSIDLLRHVVDRVLPQLDDDETQAIAQMIIEEEIGWREAWQNRLDEPFPFDAIDDDQESS